MEHRFATPRTEEEEKGPKTVADSIRAFFWHHEMIETFALCVAGIVIVVTVVGGIYLATHVEIASIPFGFG